MLQSAADALSLSMSLSPPISGPTPSGVSDVDPERRFGGIDRLYGMHALACLQARHVCVVGVGGVGSWAAEALVRSGVGRLTLIDLDHVAESNINRQVHALTPTLGQAKVLAMRERIALINPLARVDLVDDFLTPDNAAQLLSGCDAVIDAIDQVRAKVAIVTECRRLGVPLVVCGAAGGKTDPGGICLDDLSRTVQDPLLASVRRILRSAHGFPRDPRQRFRVDAVYSTQAVRRPGRTCEAQGPQGLSCAGYGSSMMMTASFGLRAAAHVVDRLLAIHRKEDDDAQ